jgi:hypothetical protein
MVAGADNGLELEQEFRFFNRQRMRDVGTVSSKKMQQPM